MRTRLIAYISSSSSIVGACVPAMAGLLAVVARSLARCAQPGTMRDGGGDQRRRTMRASPSPRGEQTKAMAKKATDATTMAGPAATSAWKEA